MPLTLEDRLRLCRQYGDFTLAYSTAVQEGLEHFGDHEGYLAYGRKWGYTFALGDPIAAKDKWPSLVSEFLKAHRKCVFVQASEKLGALLEGEGFYVNEMGVDTSLDLTEYYFDGKQKEWLRYAANWIESHDYRIAELSFDEISREQVEEVSAQWKEGKTVKKREVGFLNRPVVYADEPDVRKFYLIDASGRIEAFLFFDPLYRNGEIVGYCTCIKRRRPNAPTYAEAAIMKHAIEKFQIEGRKTLTLGLSPLAGVENKRFQHNPFLHWSFRAGLHARWINRWIYPLANHAKYKQRFRGSEEPTHYASQVLFNDSRIIAMLRLSGVF
ncbi:MAG: phosphatidylglycerol lysyltransferase domain-containing protein [Lacipirellulaceae bacterium]